MTPPSERTAFRFVMDCQAVVVSCESTARAVRDDAFCEQLSLVFNAPCTPAAVGPCGQYWQSSTARHLRRAKLGYCCLDCAKTRLALYCAARGTLSPVYAGNIVPENMNPETEKAITNNSTFSLVS